MAPPDSRNVVEALERKATAMASCLRKTVAAETADFITSTSLQILPLAQRNIKWSPADVDVRNREHSFMNLMRFLALAFVNGHTNTVESTRVAIEEELKKTDEALVTKFTQLLQVWEMDKLAEDKEEECHPKIPKSLSALPEITAPSLYLDPAGEGRRGAVVATKQTKHTNQVPWAFLQTTQNLPMLSAKTATATATTAAPTIIPSSSRPAKNNNNNNNNNTPSTHQLTLQQALTLAHKNSLTQQQQQQQPCEANNFGVETRDGVLIGHPPPYPSALLDWEDSEDVEEMEELVSRRHARTGRRGGSSIQQGTSSQNQEGNKSGSDDDEWVCL